MNLIKKYKFIIILLSIFLAFLIYFLTKLPRQLPKDNFIPGNYTAVIIEPREHKALSLVLKNFLENLSDEWNIIIMHGNKNINYVENIIQNELFNYNDRIQMINLNVDNLSIDDYNKLLLSENFYSYIPTEIFLIFQTDTLICENQKTLINDFLQYDYVGAPWSFKHIGEKGRVGGNGGLSLRKKSKMLEKIRNCNNDENQFEDMYFSNSCSMLNFPEFTKAKNFSIETVFNEKSFGVHKPWSYMSSDNLKTINENCPNLDKLIELNK